MLLSELIPILLFYLLMTAASYMSLFFDVEARANALTSDISSRLSCTQNIITTAASVSAGLARRQGLPAPAKLNVLWAYNYGA